MPLYSPKEFLERNDIEYKGNIFEEGFSILINKNNGDTFTLDTFNRYTEKGLHLLKIE